MKKTILSITALLFISATPSFAEEFDLKKLKIEPGKSGISGSPTYTITLKDHKFSPETITIPADLKVLLVVKNEDASAAEFESKSLNREKVIAGNQEATLFIGPVKAGEYPFVDEFHEDVAKGTIIAK